jgi:hypothetical protein
MPKAPRDCVYPARFLNSCMWYTVDLWGGGSRPGSSWGVGKFWMKGQWCQRNGIWLASVGRQLLILAHITVGNPATSQSLWLSNYGTVLYFLDSSRQNTWRLAQLEALSHLAPNDFIRIVFNTLKIVDYGRLNSPHATSAFKYSTWNRVKCCCIHLWYFTSILKKFRIYNKLSYKTIFELTFLRFDNKVIAKCLLPHLFIWRTSHVLKY